MRTILSLLVLSCTTAANADSLCGKFLPCQTFQGPMTEITDGKNDLVGQEMLTIADGGEARLTLTGKNIDTDGKTFYNYTFTLVFDLDGDYNILFPGSEKIQGSGHCKDGICTYALTPNRGQSVAGVITSKDGALVRSQLGQTVAGEVSVFASRMNQSR